jgi:hypothetical protein
VTESADAALRSELERASSDLVYSSESDRPFEFFSIHYPGRNSAPLPADLLCLLGAPVNTPIAVRSLREFFNRHTATSDPYDNEAQRIRPRYENLVSLLERRLRDVKVYRVGKIEINCYALGLDGEGNLAGLKTVAVET